MISQIPFVRPKQTVYNVPIYIFQSDPVPILLGHGHSDPLQLHAVSGRQKGRRSIHLHQLNPPGELGSELRGATLGDDCGR